MAKGSHYGSQGRRGQDQDWEGGGDFSRQRMSHRQAPPSVVFGATDSGVDFVRKLDAAVADAAVGAIVKWYNDAKGYGFVALDDGSGDAFLHVNLLGAVGKTGVEAGMKLTVTVGSGQKGRQVMRVLDIDEHAAEATKRSEEMARSAAAIELTGRVKWFDAQKGYGFVITDIPGKDVFLHSTVVVAAGLYGLKDGQPVHVRVVDTPKGREALSISI